MIKEICSCVCRGFLGDKEDLQLCAQRLQLSAQLEDLKGSAAVCADQNCGFCKELNKHSSVDVAPTLGVNHVISCVAVLCVVSVMFFHALINIYLISKITAK